MTLSKQTPAGHRLQSDRKRLLDARAGGAFGGAESSNDWSSNLTPPNAPRQLVTISPRLPPTRRFRGQQGAEALQSGRVPPCAPELFH